LVGATVVDRLVPADLSRPTPCVDWDVRQLLTHLVATTLKFSAFARGETDRPRTPAGNLLGTGFRPSYWDAARESGVAWEWLGAASATAPGAELGRPLCRLPFGDFPAAVAADINLFDVVVHGWDLATAVGVAFAAPGDLIDIALGVAHRLATPEARAVGQYGAPPESSPEGGTEPRTPMDRLLALTGRQPSAP
jgi:uncharacterized protein (TIGR03086 family)